MPGLTFLDTAFYKNGKSVTLRKLNKARVEKGVKHRNEESWKSSQIDYRTTSNVSISLQRNGITTILVLFAFFEPNVKQILSVY